MTSKPLEIRVSAVFDNRAAYVGGEKFKIDGLKRHTRTDVITHCWPTLIGAKFNRKNNRADSSARPETTVDKQ